MCVEKKLKQVLVPFTFAEWQQVTMQAERRGESRGQHVRRIWLNFREGRRGRNKFLEDVKS